MPTTAAKDSLLLDPLERLRELRCFQGEPDGFWPKYLECLSLLAGTEACVIALSTGDDWRILAREPSQGDFQHWARLFHDSLPDLSERTFRTGWAVAERGGSVLVSVALQLDSREARCLFLGAMGRDATCSPPVAARSVLSANDLYAQFRILRTVGESVELRDRVAVVLEVSGAVLSHERFLAAATTLANELCDRHACDRASLGWCEGGLVRLEAMSHSDGFERKMEASRSLVDAMEEAVDQDADMAYPLRDGSGLVDRCHAICSARTGSPHLATVLLRTGSVVQGALTLERTRRAFDDAELRALRLCAEQVVRHLSHLREKDRWFGARWAASLRKGAGGLVGFEHTWAKVGAVSAAAAVALAVSVPVPWRATGTAILRTEDVLHLTSPYDGYLDTCLVRPGDVVVSGQELAELDRRELFLQEAELSAELSAREREVQKAQAESDLPGIRIGSAQWEQSRAKLATLRRHLELAVLRCPFDRAVVVEGDLQEKRGTPVPQGTELLTLARLDKLHAEIEIDETEIANIQGAGTAEIALMSRPGLKERVRIERVHPSARIHDKANVFVARVVFLDPVPEWFRPGMTGVAKVDGGRRTLWWIASHKALDVLRMKLWW